MSSEPKPPHICRYCHHWEGESKLCFRYPPTPVAKPYTFDGTQIESTIEYLYPATEENEFCGEWAPVND